MAVEQSFVAILFRSASWVSPAMMGARVVRWIGASSAARVLAQKPEGDGQPTKRLRASTGYARSIGEQVWHLPVDRFPPRRPFQGRPESGGTAGVARLVSLPEVWGLAGEGVASGGSCVYSGRSSLNRGRTRSRFIVKPSRTC